MIARSGLRRRNRTGAEGHGPSCDAVLRPVAPGDRKRKKDPAGERCSEPVREPELCIGFEQRRRRPAQPGCDDHRPRDVAAASEDDVGAPPAEDREARRGSAGSDRERPREREPGPARKPGALEGVELVTGLRDEPCLDAIPRPGEAHLDAALPQRLCDCECGQHVPRRSPGRDHAPELSLLRHDRPRC